MIDTILMILVGFILGAIVNDAFSKTSGLYERLKSDFLDLALKESGRAFRLEGRIEEATKASLSMANINIHLIKENTTLKHEDLNKLTIINNLKEENAKLILEANKKHDKKIPKTGSQN